MAVDSGEWYPLPEVSPAEDHWWNKENVEALPSKMICSFKIAEQII